MGKDELVEGERSIVGHLSTGSTFSKRQAARAPAESTEARGSRREERKSFGVILPGTGEGTE